MSADPQFTRAAAAAEIDRIFEIQQRRRPAMALTTAAERIERIRKLEDAMLARRDEIRAALWADYEKPVAEADLTEIYAVLGEARHARRHLRSWMKPRRVGTPLSLLGSRSRLTYEPKGVVLIISPWNFPVNLTFGPLVSAIAAGNCAIIKPSEMTPHTSAVMKRIVADLYHESEVTVIEGDATVAEDLLKKRFDHIFFTGSPRVGRIVMRAAAEHLTSVTLELGGKSPAIVDRTANLAEAAKKIAWGKTLNSGQICIAPDYVLVDETVREEFLKKVSSAIAALGPAGERSAVVNETHGRRMKQLLDDAVARGARVVTGGQVHGRTLEPTVVENVDPESTLMKEEIFGPILPVLTYRSIDDAIAMIAKRDKPLVLYVFSRSRAFVRNVLRKTTAGGTVVNDALLHFFQLNLPFGGVGESGVGKAHGFFGFEAFSNARGVLEQPTRFAGIQLMYPPYTKMKQKLIDLMMKYV